MGICRARLRKSMRVAAVLVWHRNFQGPRELRFAHRLSRQPEGDAAQPHGSIDAGEANPFGLLHVHGNVAEWVEDCWQERSRGCHGMAWHGPTGIVQPARHTGRIVNDEPKDVRSAKRHWQAATDRRSQIGFRVARELKL